MTLLPFKPRKSHDATEWDLDDQLMNEVMAAYSDTMRPHLREIATKLAPLIDPPTHQGIPLAQRIAELEERDRTLKSELDAKINEINTLKTECGHLKQLMRDKFPLHLIRKLSVCGLILGGSSLCSSYAYKVSFIHPIFAGGILLVAMTFFLMSLTLRAKSGN